MKKIVAPFLSIFCIFFSLAEIGFAPKVSIITSLYDGNEFIAGFLSDITRQTIFEKCELIIINANSPGNEEPIIKEYQKKFPNIKYKRLEYDPGLYAVWNLAIKMARGDYITNANVDDRRNPVCLAMHAKALDENRNIDLVYSDFFVTFNPNETFEWNSHQYTIMPDDFSPNIMYKCITGPQPMWRKKVHDQYGYFDESFKCAGDFEMWNRAVSLGAKFQKVNGVSGIFYLNPKGLSTDTKKQDIQQAELYRINDRYGYMWITDYHYFCTAADSRYFNNLLNLIGSIHEVCFEKLGEIAVFDLGLTDEQICQLRSISKVSVHHVELTHPDLLKQFVVSPSGKTVAGWYAWKFVILKQALELFPYALWVDAGTTILKPLDNLFKYIQETGYFICTIGDEKLNNQIYHPIKWGTTEHVKRHFNLDSAEKKWVLEQEPLLSGVIGVSRKCYDYLVRPLYEMSKNLRLFEDDGTTPNGFGTGRHDLVIVSIFAYLNGLAVYHQDSTQKKPILLDVNGNYEELYITWNAAFVDDRTSIYNSRDNLSNFQRYLEKIQYRKA